MIRVTVEIDGVEVARQEGPQEPTRNADMLILAELEKIRILLREVIANQEADGGTGSLSRATG